MSLRVTGMVFQDKDKTAVQDLLCDLGHLAHRPVRLAHRPVRLANRKALARIPLL